MYGLGSNFDDKKRIRTRSEGERGFKGKKGDFICRVLVVLACEWGIDRGWKEGEKKVGGKKTMKERRKEGVVVCHKTSHCLSQGQVLALFLMNSFILFCWLYLHQQQKTPGLPFWMLCFRVCWASRSVLWHYLCLLNAHHRSNANLRLSSTGKGIAN